MHLIMVIFNKMYSLLYIIYVFIFFPITEIDPAAQEIQEQFLNDTFECLLLSNFDQINVLYEVLPLDVKSNKEVQERLFLAKALNIYKNGNYVEAKDHFLQLMNQNQIVIDSLVNSSLYSDTQLYARIGLSKYFQTIGENEKAEAILKSIIKWASDHNRVQIVLLSKYNLINLYETLGSYPRALELGLNILNQTKKSRNLILQSGIYSQLGSIYLATADTLRAFDYHKKALNIRENLNYEEGIAKSTRNLAYIYELLNQNNLALQHYLRAKKLCEKLDYTKGLIKALTGLGRTYLRLNDAHKALLYLSEANYLSNEHGYEKGKIESLIQLARYHSSVGDFHLVPKYTSEALSMAEKSDQLAQRVEIYRIRSHYFEMIGDLASALDEIKIYNKLHTQLVNREKNQQIARIETNQIIQQQKRDNTILKATNALQSKYLTQNRILLVIMGVLFLLSIVVLFLFKSRSQIKGQALKDVQKAKEQIQKQNEQLQRLSKEKDRLFGVISHELRNPLWWFRNLIEMLSVNFYSLSKNEVEESLKTLQDSANQAYHLTDNLLSWSKLQMKQVKPLIQVVSLDLLLQESLKLYAMAIQIKRISLQIEISKGVAVHTDHRIGSTMIRNLISNAIKYAPEESIIFVFSEITDHDVKLVIENSGEALSKELQEWLCQKSSEAVPEGLQSHISNGLGLLIVKDLGLLSNTLIHYERSYKKTNVFSLSWKRAYSHMNMANPISSDYITSH